jgi:hypothetical protein
MNTKDFLRLGVPLGQATRRATDFISKFILGGGASGSAEFSPLHRARFAFAGNGGSRRRFRVEAVSTPRPGDKSRLRAV